MRTRQLLLGLLVTQLVPPCRAQTGGVPPKARVTTKLCTISSVFGKLLRIKNAPACRSGCAGGKCPTDWMPGTADKCSAPCGKVFEPFWDECGKMLAESKMGGMKEMAVFYDHCLKSLYPPGSCGAYCNAHTFDCYMKEVKQSCCDEGGANCPAGMPVPSTCPVGCALVFPEFLETCRTHLQQQAALCSDPSACPDPLLESKFEAFEKKCLALDSLALVEYAIELQAQGCTINLAPQGSGGHRRTQRYLGQWIPADDPTKKCGWDQINDYAQQVDRICCGPGGSRCRGGAPPTGTCTPACAVAAHAFATDCQQTLRVFMPSVTDPRRLGILRFESSCVKSVDPKFFLKAIMKAKCPKNTHKKMTKPGARCTAAQENMAAKCVQNCDGCDRKKVAAFVATCTIVGHGAAVTTIEDACNVQSHGGAPGPPPRVICSMLQQAVVAQCRRNCKACDERTVMKQVGDCMLPNNVAAKNDLCVKVGPSSRPQLQLSYPQLMALYSLLDEDKNGQLSVHELIDLFDGINNDALLVNDCNNHPMPHHWLGDGFCDDGKDRKDGQGDFNCNIFNCDDKDCGTTCRKVLGRDQVEVAPDGPTVYGHVKDAKGETFECDLKKGVKYYLWTNIGKSKGHIGDTVLTLMDKNARTVLKRNDDGPHGKQNSYLEYTPDQNIDDATIKVTPKTRADRGSFQMWLTTVKPTCLTCPQPLAGVTATPPSPTGPKKCTPVQQKVIAVCKSDCLACNKKDVAIVLSGCRLDTDTRPQQPGKTFCVVTAQPCTAAQHLQLAKCLSNCPKCNVAQTKAAMGFCRAEGGDGAIDLIERECAHHRPCSPLQQAVAAKCTQNCKACDSTKVGVVLGMCDLKGHGPAMTFITDTCSAPAVNRQCTLLQSAIMSQCQKSCQTCKVGQVRKMLGDCVMQNGQAAALQMCPNSQTKPCGPFQQSIVQQCSRDCFGCKMGNVRTALAGCTVSGIVQRPGVTFCTVGRPCSPLQQAVLRQCVQNNCKKACHIADVSLVLGMCALGPKSTPTGHGAAVTFLTDTCRNKLDLRAMDYSGRGTTWKARVGPSARLYGNPKFNKAEGSLFFDNARQWASVPLNTDGHDMPQVSYALWAKLDKPIPGNNLGWVMSQYPDQGWNRAITLSDGRLSRTRGVSVTYGGGWRNTLPRPPVNQWFHVVATWDQNKPSCVYLNAKLGQCAAARNGKHPSRKEQLIIGGRGPNDGRHNPSVKVHSAKVYTGVLSQIEVSSLYTSYQPGSTHGG